MCFTAYIQIISGVLSGCFKGVFDMSSEFGFNKVLSEDVLTVNVSGRIDTETSPELDSGIKADLNGVKKLVLDLSDVEYISSSGLRVLLGFNKTLSSNGGEFVVRKPSQMVREVFDITNFSDILNIEQ